MHRASKAPRGTSDRSAPRANKARRVNVVRPERLARPENPEKSVRRVRPENKDLSVLRVIKAPSVRPESRVRLASRDVKDLREPREKSVLRVLPERLVSVLLARLVPTALLVTLDLRASKVLREIPVCMWVVMNRPIRM